MDRRRLSTSATAAALFLGITAAFNLDPFHPVIYQVPEDAGKEPTFFGASVAIRPRAASLEDAWAIQIGAPRAGEGDHRPGTVYRCRLRGPCRRFAPDEEVNPFGGRGAFEFKEKKDEAWIGVAMNIERFGAHERSIVCGHRWMNRELRNPEHIDVTYLVTGACYLQDLLNETFEAPVQRLLPLVNKDKIYAPKPYVVDLSTYHWGLGQAGICVKMTADSSDVLIGAPGVTHWIGSVVRYRNDFDAAVANFARTEIPRKSRYTYLGYSVAFGRFYKDKELWFVSGAPRSANYHGEVFTFQFKGPSNDVRIRSVLSGATFGEYFGSSLAADDFDGDGFDDLIVGAPFFAREEFDEGRIYVFLGSGRGNYMTSAQVIDGRHGGGRFGFCVSSLGDLDQDGHADVAVGAPYEDGNGGAVYVYKGSAEGLNAEFAQRIRARDVHPQLRGFGVSLSSAVDVDGNKFSDVAVGAHLSGHVVLFRSRPVVSLHPTIRIDNLTLIDRQDSHVNVSLCARYSGASAPPQVEILRTLVVDPVFGRAKTAHNLLLDKKVVRLRANEIICEILPLFLDVSKDNYSPLPLTLKNEIGNCDKGKLKGSSLLVKGERVEGADNFPKLCPTGKKAETSIEVPFAGVCGSDFTCRSDLALSCRLTDVRSGVYVLGSTRLLVLAMEVENNGEPAHHVKIKIWFNLKVKHEGKSKKTHWVDVEGILIHKYKVEFPFELDDEELREAKGDTRLSVRVEIFTSSLESDLKDNSCLFLVRLLSESHLELNASSSNSSVYVGKQTETLNITHFYEVQRKGATPLEDAQLLIYIPFHLRKEFLSFQVETSQGVLFSPVQVGLGEGREMKQKAVTKEIIPKDFVRSTEKCPPPNRTLFLNCSTPDIACAALEFFFTRGIPPGFSYVKLFITLNMTAIDEIREEKDIVHLSTFGVLGFSRLLGAGPEELRRSASSSLYDEDREKSVGAHVIALSVLAGGFFLFLIIAALVKNNFFKRAKKEELEALKGAAAGFVYFTTGLAADADQR